MAYKNNETAREWARHRKGSSNEYGLGNAKGLSLAPERNLASYGVNLSDYAQKQIKEAYASTFANSYDHNVDQERMQKGLMPTAFDKKYADTELDRLLYQMGLPSAADLPAAVDDYNKATAPERQYQQIFNDIGRDLRPFLDEEGNISQDKVLDYIYNSKFNSEAFSDLYKQWDEYDPAKTYNTTEEALRAGLEIESGYNIKKLMDDLNSARNRANMWDLMAATTPRDTKSIDGAEIETVGTIDKTAKQIKREARREKSELDAADAGALQERAYQLQEEISFGITNGIDTAAAQDELAEIQAKLYPGFSAAEEQREATREAKKAAKAEREAQDEAFRAIFDVGRVQHTTSALGAAPILKYDEGLQAELDAYRAEQLANGMSPLEIDNIFRRNGFKEYLNADVARNYAATIIAESNGLSYDQGAAVYDALPQSEKDMYGADMQFDNRVHETWGEEAGRALIAVPARAALDIVNSVFNFADMVMPQNKKVTEILENAGKRDPSEVVRDMLNEWSYKLGQYGSSETHEFINVASDVTTEIVKMYALNAAGLAAASATGASPAIIGSTTASQKGMGLLMNMARRVGSVESLPFMVSSIGSGYNQALMDGANRGEATVYGLISGVLEGALEAIGADEMFNKTFTQSFVKSSMAGGKELISKGGSKFINLVSSAIGNGMEEGAGYLLSGVAEMATYNPQWKPNSTEFWENVGMGALVGTFGAMATMPETSRTYQLLQEAIETGDLALAEQAKAAYDVETMPQAKYDYRIQEAMELPLEEYRKVVGDRNKAILDATLIQEQYDKQVSSADARVSGAQKGVDDLIARLKAINPVSNIKATEEVGQLAKEIASAKTTLAKTIESANAAKQTAQKEYESALSNAIRRRDVEQRRIDDHAIAYDLRMQQMLARDDVERAIAELSNIEQQSVAIYDRLNGLDRINNVSEVQALEQMLQAYSERKTALDNIIDEGVRTEEWLAMQNRQAQEAWRNDTEWQSTLQRIAEARANEAEQAARQEFTEKEAQSEETVVFDVDVSVPEDIETGEATLQQEEAPEEAMSNDVLGIIDPRINEVITAARKAGRRVYQNFVSGQAPLERIGKKQTGIENGKATITDLVQMVRASGGGVKTVLYDRLIDKDGVDLNLGSWKDMVASIPKGLEGEFMRYCLLLHSVDRMSLKERGFGENKPVFAKDGNANGKPEALSSEESARKVEELAEKNPEFVALANKMHSWWDTFMRKWAVDGGLISNEAYEHMREMYPHYVPTFRVGKKRSDSSISQGATSIGISDPVRSASGSFDTVANIYDTFAKQINKMVRSERANEMLLSLYSFAERNPNVAAGEGVILLDGNTETVDAEQDLDVSMDSLALETLEKTKDGNYIIRARRDGEIVAMQVSPEIYKAVDLLIGSSYGDSSKAQAIDKGFKMLNNLANVFKGGITTYNPLFALTNAFRDFQSSYINSDAGMFEYFGNIRKAVSEMVSDGENWKAFKALGGKTSGYVGSDKGFLLEAFGKEKALKRALSKAGDILSAPGEATESLFRFSEYLQGIKKYGDTPDGRRKAIQMAADVSVNFARNAPLSKATSSFVLYFNAQIQGIDKIARQIKSAPGKTLLKNTPFLALAAALLKLVGNEENPHYQNLSDHVKDTYFLVPNVFGQRDTDGNCTTFIKVPKNREYGAAIVALFERAMRVPEEGFEAAFDGWWENVSTNFIPSNPLTENMFAPLSVFKTNKNYYGGDVVPQYMADDPVTEQYTAQTSLVSRNISEFLNSVGVEASPMHIDYVINQLGGIYGDMFISATSEDAGNIGGMMLDVLDDKFVADPLYSSGIVSRFYDVCDEVAAAASDAEQKRTENGSNVLTIQERQKKQYDTYKKKISELRKQERELLASEKNTKERKAKIDAIRTEINEIAKQAVLEYEPQS